MKRKVLALSLALAAPLLTGCDALFGSIKKTDELPKIDNSVDLVEAESIDGTQTYYSSKSVDLVTYVNGNYSIDKTFTLDPEADNKRVFHDIYFYEDDYFQALYYSSRFSLGTPYALLDDESDTQYVTQETTQKGTPYQLTIVSEGIYDVIFDTETFAFDLVRKGDIDTPVYEKAKTCELNVFDSASKSKYYPMQYIETSGEWYIEQEIPQGASLGFFSASHNSHYKLVASADIADRYVYLSSTIREQPQVHVGGTYKVYFNATTYELRLELLNPDTAAYYCQVGWNQGVVLSPAMGAPYLFEYTFEAQGKPDDPYVKLPKFFPQLGMEYALTVVDENDITFAGKYVKESGTYKLTVNLKDFTLTVAKI